MFLTITVSEALGRSVVGFAIVFATLIVLMVIIKAISAIAILIDGGNKQPESAPAQSTPAPVPVPVKTAVPAGMVPAKGSLGEVKLHDTDEKTAALIMAIVADELKVPLNELRFVSIRTK